MEILKIEHEDFDLVIKCNDLITAFNKAKRKQKEINSSTSYKIKEGEIFLYDFETEKLKQLKTDKTHPLIFENKDYCIDIDFKDIDETPSPKILTRIKSIKEKFDYKPNHKLLAGNVNFSNNIGKSELKFDYQKAGKTKSICFEFEVFPTKLNYKKDYNKIISDIEKEYPQLVLDFLRKTYQSFRAGDHENSDLIWWEVFGGLYKDFLKAS